MAKYLVETKEVYRVDTEEAAAALIDEAKNDNKYTLSRYTSIKKEKKLKGEIIDEWYQVSLVKNFNDEKDPGNDVDVKYEVTF